MKESINILFYQAEEQQIGSISKLIGYIDCYSFVELAAKDELHANPRLSKEGEITKAIIDTLKLDIKEHQNLFSFKSKGICIGLLEAPRYLSELEDGKKRYKIQFNRSPEYFKKNGIMDGGHNTLALSLYILEVFSKESKKETYWSNIRNILEDHKDIILSEIKTKDECKNIHIPVEFIYPTQDSEKDLKVYLQSLHEITRARNTNSQLKATALDNYEHIYDGLKKGLDSKIVENVRWRENAPQRIDLTEIFSILGIVLANQKISDDIKNVAELRDKSKSNINLLWKQKKKTTKIITDLLRNEDVCTMINGEYTITHPLIQSAMLLTNDLFLLSDYIEEYFSYYHDSFIDVNKEKATPNKSKKYYTTFFYQKEYQLKEVQYPRGLLFPILFGFNFLIEKQNHTFSWITNPFIFIETHLKNIIYDYLKVLKDRDYCTTNVPGSTETYAEIKTIFNKYLSK